MGFADAYLERRDRRYGEHIKDVPDSLLRQIVVIPCYDEPDVISTLDSLCACDAPDAPVEVIVVVNASMDDADGVHQRNSETISKISSWCSMHTRNNISFHFIHAPAVPAKYAGVGMARKIGMDEAVYRFEQINNPNGVIVSLDADSICDTNYLREIERHYVRHPETNGATIYFEHPLDGPEPDKKCYYAITKYELFLRYYLMSIRYLTLPYAFHTVGSCFTVKASAYVRQGGMNVRSAGEDFYFLQKLIPLGNFYEIQTTTVHPSSRSSHRVPFGTGASVRKLLADTGMSYLTYDFNAFKDYKKFYDMMPDLYRKSVAEIREMITLLPASVSTFLDSINAAEEVDEINQNTADRKAFKKRFWQRFNMFRVMKLLNHAHESHCARVPVHEAVAGLLAEKNVSCENLDEKGLLLLLRKLEKESTFYVR